MRTRLSMCSSPHRSRRREIAHLCGRLPCYSVLALLAVSALVGCSQQSRNAPSRQVVAKVNGQEITIHQLKNELTALTSRGAVATNVAPTKQMLDSLIDEQLLVEQGKQRKLDHDPQVMLAIERARRQIVAQAMQTSLAAALPPPPLAEIKAFYEANPALFAKRRIYTFYQFMVDRGGLSDTLKTRLDRAKSRAALLIALRAESVAFRELVSARTAEQLPMAALPAIAAMQRGDVTVINDGNEATILQLIDFIEQPATIEEATPLIREYLLNTRKKELVAERLIALRASAKIEYLGPFAEGALPAPQAAHPIQAAQADQAAQTKTGQPAISLKAETATAKANGGEENYLSKGPLRSQK
jgi:EpsD family peptidyl-prolyl cis-trans isomerase